jgi:hypothetical protein
MEISRNCPFDVCAVVKNDTFPKIIKYTGKFKFVSYVRFFGDIGSIA